MVAFKNSLTLHVIEFASLLLQPLLQGVTLLLQAHQSFSPLELLAGHLDPERRAVAPGSSTTQPAGFQVPRIGSRVPGFQGPREEVEGDTVVSQQRVKTRSSGCTLPPPAAPGTGLCILTSRSHTDDS